MLGSSVRLLQAISDRRRPSRAAGAPGGAAPPWGERLIRQDHAAKTDMFRGSTELVWMYLVW